MGLNSDAWVSPFPRCLTSCAVLSFYLFFFLLRSELGQVNKIKTLEGAAPGLGAVMRAPPSYGAGTEPYSKLLINCWLF